MGIDPGKSGGICILDDENIYTLSMTNKTEMDIYRHFKAYKVIGRAEPISLS